MSWWHRYAYAGLRGALKSIPVGGSVLVEVLNEFQQHQQEINEAAEKTARSVAKEFDKSVVDDAEGGDEAGAEAGAAAQIAAMSVVAQQALANRVMAVSQEADPVRRQAALVELSTHVAETVQRNHLTDQTAEAVIARSKKSWQPTLRVFAELLQPHLGSLFETDGVKMSVGYKVVSPLTDKRLRLLSIGVDKVAIATGYLTQDADKSGDARVAEIDRAYRAALGEILDFDFSTRLVKEYKDPKSFKDREVCGRIVEAACTAAQAMRSLNEG